MPRGRRRSVYSSSWSETSPVHSEALAACTAAFQAAPPKRASLLSPPLSSSQLGGLTMITVDRRKSIKKVIADASQSFKEKFRLNANILIKC